MAGDRNLHPLLQLYGPAFCIHWKQHICPFGNQCYMCQCQNRSFQCVELLTSQCATEDDNSDIKLTMQILVLRVVSDTPIHTGMSLFPVQVLNSLTPRRC